MERYEKYKDSGVEWIGEIPAGWEVKKIKYISTLQGGFAFKSESFAETGIPVIRIGDVRPTINFDDCKKVPEQIEVPDEFVLQKGDTLVALSGATTGKTTFIEFDPKRTYINQRVAKVEFDNKLLFFNISGDFVHKIILLTATGSAQENISTSQIGNIDIAIPLSKSSQTAIANYLDRKTAEIDELIAQKERLLELYEEEKTAIINQAVTKGIDPDGGATGEHTGSPQRDSGIDWLGEIPEGWEVVALKRATRIIRGKFGHRPRNDPDFYDGEYPFIQTGDIANADKYVELFTQTLNEKGFAVSQEFPVNTLVMTIAANIGDLAILSFKACFPDSIVGFYPLHENSSEFLYYLFTSMKAEFLRVSTNNTQLNINIDRISPLKIPIPPIPDQTAIVTHIETETARINAKIARTKKIIELQKEYRTALISEVVTGKIKVTDDMA